MCVVSSELRSTASNKLTSIRVASEYEGQWQVRRKCQILRYCSIHLKKSSSCQRARWIAAHPSYGYRRLWALLRLGEGVCINSAWLESGEEWADRARRRLALARYSPTGRRRYKPCPTREDVPRVCETITGQQCVRQKRSR